MGSLLKWLGVLFLGPDDRKQVGAVEAVASAVDKATYTEQEKAKDDTDDTASARQFIPAPSHGSWLDVLVDGWHRLIRPAFATWALFIVAGWIQPPRHLETLPAVAGTLVLTIIGFYFGGRLLVKDAPATVMRVLEMVRRMKEKA